MFASDSFIVPFTTRIAGIAVTLPAELLEILVCPKCKSALEYHKAPTEALVCRQCQLVYAVQDGIPIMLIDEAKPLKDGEFPPENTTA